MPEKPHDGHDGDLYLDGIPAGGGVTVLSTEPRPEKGPMGFLAAIRRAERYEKGWEEPAAGTEH